MDKVSEFAREMILCWGGRRGRETRGGEQVGSLWDKSFQGSKCFIIDKRSLGVGQRINKKEREGQGYYGGDSWSLICLLLTGRKGGYDYLPGKENLLNTEDY